MSDIKKVLAISGSTREQSTNLNLLQAITELYANELQVNVFESLSQIPNFYPDLDTDSPPKAVIDFRNQLREADGILICTPEYAMGVPGTLKNAIDWTVSSLEFSHKPTALITASSQGYKGHASLMETLRIIESEITDESQLVISFAKTKIKGNKIIDAATLSLVEGVVDSFIRTMEKVEKDNTLDSGL